MCVAAKEVAQSGRKRNKKSRPIGDFRDNLATTAICITVVVSYWLCYGMALETL